MRRLLSILPFTAAFTALLCASAFAWDVYYDSSVMPNDPSLGSESWCSAGSLSNSSVQDGVLHLATQDTTTAVYFSRDWALGGGTPITLETCVMVDSGTGAAPSTPPALIQVENNSGHVSLGVYTNHITVDSSAQSVDMTSFHVIRIALQADNTYQVWLDGNQVFSGTATMTCQSGMAFGSYPLPGGTLDSYWDYVGYSLAYIPPQ